MPRPQVEFLSVSKGVTRPHTFDNSIIAQNRNIDYLPPIELTMHSHAYFCFTYIIDTDEFTSLLNGTKISFLKDHLYLQPPNTLHTPTDQFGGTRTSISIRFAVNSPKLSNLIGKNPSVTTCDAKIKKLIFEISDFEKSPLPQTKLNELCCELLSLFLLSSYRKIILPQFDSCSNSAFVKLIRYMYSNYDRDITLADMAAFMHMEATYFLKKFKSLYNITPINYLYSIRLFRSLDILMYTNLSIADISAKVGFKNVASFCTAFRRAYNISPSEYRREAQSRKFDITE